ncbi:hypothetical protein KCTCHS21_14240 [Cohnella abietis]|uniref:Uncharacterized protein n=1 Tax=Cohnella abietis TaxID=2507935 RepID=A0A3T1D1Z0_9BACL|nr:hypothetical protein KCTCHS21_14240 [Cohnella abietis]
MSTVIRNKVHTAKKFYECDSCRRQISPGIKYRRIFGSAYASDPLRELKLCGGCTDIKETTGDGHSDIMFAG